MMKEIFRRSAPVFQPPTSDVSTEEIKTALQVKIFGREKKEGTQYFIIRIWLVYAPSEISDAIRKRFNQFFELHEKMLMLGYQDLPAFPGKKIFMTDKDTDER